MLTVFFLHDMANPSITAVRMHSIPGGINLAEAYQRYPKNATSTERSPKIALFPIVEEIRTKKSELMSKMAKIVLIRSDAMLPAIKYPATPPISSRRL